MRSLTGAGRDEDDDAPAPKRRPKSTRGKPKISRGRKGAEPGFVARWADSFRSATKWAAFWSGLIAVFFAIVTVAGLFSGGHVAAALESVRKDSETVMVRAGLKVDSILVEGRNQTGSEEITRMLGIKPGDLMAYADIDEARARLEALPWVKFAEVRRVWPNKIQVRLVERRPVALWQLNGVTSVIDRDGMPIPGEMPSRHTDLPLVVGKGAGLVVESLLSLVSSQPDLKLRVKAAVRVGERRWNLQLANGVEVRLPEEGADAALADLVRLDREKHILSRDIKAIDLRFADRYVVKLPPGSPLIAPVRTSGGRET